MNDVLPKSKHGYFEFYWSDGQLARKGVMFNNDMYGYFNYNSSEGLIYKDLTGYYIKSKKVSDSNESGYCYIWSRVEL